MIMYNNTDGSTGYNCSSKGNQLKFCVGDKWYKADFLGYEAASEYLVSRLLERSNVHMFVPYSLHEITYNGRAFNGCVSDDFLKPGQQLITAERLYKSYYGHPVEDDLRNMSLDEKILNFVNAMEDITGLSHFGEYLTTLMELDAFTLNEDRHFHNIAVVRNPDETYTYCPVFDNGAAFLSDTRSDYPLEKNTLGLIASVKAKPFCKDFDEQMERCEALYGVQLQLYLADLSDVLADIEKMYGTEISDRMQTIYEHQKYMYQELFRPGPEMLAWEEECQDTEITQPEEEEEDYEL